MTSHCETRGRTGSGGSVGGIAVLTTLKNTGQAPLAVGRCELLRLPRNVLHQAPSLPPAAGTATHVDGRAQQCRRCPQLQHVRHAPHSCPGSSCRRHGRVPELEAVRRSGGGRCQHSGGTLRRLQLLAATWGEHRPRDRWVSDWAAPESVWEAWPALAAKAMDARLPKKTPVGWLCWSWQDPLDPELSGSTCAEDLYLQSAKALADQGFCERGMDFLWLSQTYMGDSDGYTTLPGAWTTEDKKQHPHGLAWLVEKVKALGFTRGLGLWCAPFWIPNLPSWASRYGHCCLQDKDSQPIVHEAGDGGEWRFLTPTLKTGFLCLDGSHPDAQSFIGARRPTRSIASFKASAPPTSSVLPPQTTQPSSRSVPVPQPVSPCRTAR